MDQKNQNSRAPLANVGIVLVVLGIVLLVLQHVHLDISWLPREWSDFSWQMRIIAGGLIVFIVGLVLPDSTGEGLSGLGFVMAAVGALLWYQESTGIWSSWAYAWALVFPAAGGLAGIIHGTVHANWRHVRDSFGSLVFGLVTFLVLGFVFERWLGVGGFGLDRIASWIPGAVLLGLGVLVLFTGVPYGSRERSEARERRRMEHEQRHTGYRQSGGEQAAPPQGWTSAPTVPPDGSRNGVVPPSDGQQEKPGNGVK